MKTQTTETEWGQGVQYGREFGRWLADSNLREALAAYIAVWEREEEESVRQYMRGVMFGLEAEMGRRQVEVA